MSQNKYIYGSDDPVNFSDPSGQVSRKVAAAIGIDVHNQIGQDFILRNPLNRYANYTPIGEILRIPLPYSTCRPLPFFCALEPDLVDASTHEVYEIKPLAGVQIAQTQLFVYIATLILSDPLKRPWGRGYSYFPPNIIYPRNNALQVALVSPPINGIILYQLVDFRTALIALLLAPLIVVPEISPIVVPVVATI